MGVLTLKLYLKVALTKEVKTFTNLTEYETIGAYMALKHA